MNSGTAGVLGFPSRALEERFWEKVRRGPECWEWTGAVDADGYGRISVKGPKGHRMALAHRVAFELTRGPMRRGLQADHLCRNRHCVNPIHIEPVTSAENTRRGDAGRRQPRARGRFA